MGKDLYRPAEQVAQNRDSLGTHFYSAAIALAPLVPSKYYEVRSKVQTAPPTDPNQDGTIMISALADWVTFAGFLLTVWVFIETFGLKKTFLSRARIPELRKDLRAVSVELLKAIGNDVPGEIAALCARAEAMLVSTKTKVDGEHKKRIAKLLKDIAKVRSGNVFSVEIMKPIYDELVGVTEMLINLEKDISWRA